MGLRPSVPSAGRQALEERINDELTDLVTQVINEIDWLMREDKISRADLAARMGVSPGRVSQVLSGGENLTLRTLATLGAALDAHFEVELRPAEEGTDGDQAPHVTVHATDAAQAPAPAQPGHTSRFSRARLGEYSHRR
jgi:transcriptional regulator with XRE-family HTH domain